MANSCQLIAGSTPWLKVNFINTIWGVHSAIKYPATDTCIWMILKNRSLQRIRFVDGRDSYGMMKWCNRAYFLIPRFSIWLIHHLNYLLVFAYVFVMFWNFSRILSATVVCQVIQNHLELCRFWLCILCYLAEDELLSHTWVRFLAIVANNLE